MNLGRPLGVVIVAALALALVGSAWAQGDDAPRPKDRFRPKGEWRPDFQPPDGPRPMMGPLIGGADIPAVRDEMQRHIEAIRELMLGNRDLAQQVNEALRPLRDKGATPAEIEEALKKFAPQAEGVAAKLADELIKHHENLAKAYGNNRDLAIKQLALGIVKRLGFREPGPRFGPGAEKGDRPRPPFKDKGDRPAPPPKEKEAPPENF